MGYSTLPQAATVGEAVAACIGPVVLQETLRGRNGCYVHSVVDTPHGLIWAVSIVEGSVAKHLEERMGPFCDAPSADFLLAAAKLCGPVYPKGAGSTGWALGFRGRMAKARNLSRESLGIVDSPAP